MIDPTKAILDWEQDDQIMQDQRAEIARLRLTDAEREAVERAARTVELFVGHDKKITAALRGLLDRTK
jgi:hypothetical protein